MALRSKSESDRPTTPFWMPLIGIVMLISGTMCDQYKIGMIVEKECCSWSSMYIIGGAMNIALEQLREDNVVDDVDFRYVCCLSFVLYTPAAKRR